MKISYVKLFLNYLRSVVWVWILFFVAVIYVFVFGRCHDSNNALCFVISNISYSYIAGSIFFFLADIIPFVKRQAISMKHVGSSFGHLYDAVVKIEKALYNSDWNEISNEEIFFEITGLQYENDNRRMINLRSNIISIQEFVLSVNNSCAYIISQELYLDDKIFKDILKIQDNLNLGWINQLDSSKGNIIPDDGFLLFISNIKDIYQTAAKYHE